MEPFTWFLAMTAASMLLSIITTPKSPSVKPQSFDASSLPSAEEGTRIIEVFGDVNINSFMVLWYGNNRTKKIKTKSSKK